MKYELSGEIQELLSCWVREEKITKEDYSSLECMILAQVEKEARDAATFEANVSLTQD